MSTGDSLTPTLVGAAGSDDTLPAKPKADASGRDRLAYNVLASWGGHLVFIVAGFAMPRLIDSHLGQASLGIWDFGWSIVSYFVLAQVGVGSSVNRYVAKYRSVHDVEGLRRTVSSVNVIQMGATLLVLSITAFLTYYLPIFFGARLGVEAAAARWVIALLGASVATQMAFNVFGGVLTGCHRWDVHNAVNSGAYAVIAAGMAGALLLGGGLRELSFVYLVGTFGGEIVRMRMAYRICPELRIDPKLATLADIRMLFAFGGKTIVDNLARLLLTQANSLLVASHLGPAALAVYARPGALVRHMDVLVNKFALILSPASSSLKSNQRHDELRELFLQSTRFAAFMATPGTIFLAIIGGSVLQVWMGPRYHASALMALFAIGNYLPLTQRPAQQVLTGLNLHGRVGWASFAVALVGVAAAVIALGTFQVDLFGAALALVIPYTLGNGLFILIYACRQLEIPFGVYFKRVFAAPLLSGIPLALALGAVRLTLGHRPLAAMLVGLVVAAAIMVPVYWQFVLPERMRRKILNKLLRRGNAKPSGPRAAAAAPAIAASPAVAVAADEASATQVDVRHLPYPYKAAVAICSDLDLTPDKHVYFETSRFLNTTDQTSMGRGVGLEVGNTIYFDMPADQFSYWNTDDGGREMVRTLIKSGHVDCLHSFGDLARTREDAARSLDDLARHGCRLEVWIDHAIAPTNLGADIMKGRGDVAEAPEYHADLMYRSGVRYVWRGRVTSVIGQNVPRSLSGIWRTSNQASAKTLAKEAVKGLLARFGDEKYGIHKANRILRRVTLRDGRPVYEFFRSNPHPGGVSCGDTATGLAEVLVPHVLDTLVDRKAVSIIYTHLGKIPSAAEPLPPATRAALQTLADYRNDGKILVATTRRLLGFCAARERVRAVSRRAGAETIVDVEITPDERPIEAADLAGLTFYVDHPETVRVVVNGCERPVQRNAPDHTGRPSVSIPWQPLEFPRACAP